MGTSILLISTFNSSKKKYRACGDFLCFTFNVDKPFFLLYNITAKRYAAAESSIKDGFSYEISQGQESQPLQSNHNSKVSPHKFHPCNYRMSVPDGEQSAECRYYPYRTGAGYIRHSLSNKVLFIPNDGRCSAFSDTLQSLRP